jgi:hypothetical protein
MRWEANMVNGKAAADARQRRALERHVPLLCLGLLVGGNVSCSKESSEKDATQTATNSPMSAQLASATVEKVSLVADCLVGRWRSTKVEIGMIKPEYVVKQTGQVELMFTSEGEASTYVLRPQELKVDLKKEAPDKKPMVAEFTGSWEGAYHVTDGDKLVLAKPSQGKLGMDMKVLQDPKPGGGIAAVGTEYTIDAKERTVDASCKADTLTLGIEDLFPSATYERIKE